MLFSDCRVGMEVLFGRGNGEYTRGIVEKMNRVKAKVRTNENRGSTVAGTVWSVPYALMNPSSGGVPQNVQPTQPEPIKYNPFQDPVEIKILEAINIVYNRLSPENLSCDGELPISVINKNRAKLNRQLRGLFQVLGREVDEMVAYNWSREKMESENKRLSNC